VFPSSPGARAALPAITWGQLEGKRGFGGSDIAAHPIKCPSCGSTYVASFANDRFATGHFATL
jgi:hypothetical protein